jgi:hypothetical protein
VLQRRVVIREGEEGGGKCWPLPFRKSRVTVGRGLENDLIVLDPQVPDRAGRVERRGGRFFWIPWGAGGGEELGSVRLGRYCIETTRPVIEAVALTVSMAGLIVSIVAGFRSPISSSTVPADPPEVVLPTSRGYGRLNDADPPVRRLSFRFDHSGRDGAMLHFVPGGIDSVERLSIEVNGAPVGYVSPCPDGWGMEQRLFLPRTRLRFGENRVSFLLHDSVLSETRWGVRDLYVTRVPSERAEGESPESVLAEAERLFSQGGNDPDRLARVEQAAGRTITLYQSRSGQVPDKVIDLMRRVRQRRERVFVAWMAEAVRAARLGDRTRARSIYRQLLAGWNDPGDPKRKEISKGLAEVAP